MTKYFILNIVLNLAIAFLVYSGIMSFQTGNHLFLFISIALLVVLIYFKVVLLKVVKRNVREGKQQPKRKK
ncbi:DUF6358 family protein [Sphingobacterium corticibacterium]|uniref:Sortase n=1 Tax=Sphingobacterium corticibacterium TaxID=2484746 RepID=A0A4Q6XK64_9SPHI|nr:DUF6358 family protein [Sphingobacterium corticibacterium]RZF60271.1 sortase [Sphingobacterium corticibacterium]